MFNAEYADAIVENMPVTMLRCWGLVLSGYPNVLKQTVETLATVDPRIVHHGQSRINIGAAAIVTELQIDVMEADVALEVESEPPVTPTGREIGRQKWTVAGVSLNTASEDSRKQITCDVVIHQVDYLATGCEDYADTQDLKFERTWQVVFYVK